MNSILILIIAHFLSSEIKNISVNSASLYSSALSFIEAPMQGFSPIKKEVPGRWALMSDISDSFDGQCKIVPDCMRERDCSLAAQVINYHEKEIIWGYELVNMIDLDCIESWKKNIMKLSIEDEILWKYDRIVRYVYGPDPKCDVLINDARYLINIGAFEFSQKKEKFRIREAIFIAGSIYEYCNLSNLAEREYSAATFYGYEPAKAAMNHLLLKKWKR